MIAVDEERAATRGFDLLNERVLTVAGIDPAEHRIGQVERH